MNSKQLVGSIILLVALLLIFPAIIAFVITGIWVGWVLLANADGLSKEDIKYDRDETILSTKTHEHSKFEEKDPFNSKTYSALEERKALLRDEIK